MDHADQKGLLPARQSAHWQFHATESAVLVVHNNIVCAIDQALVLLDLSSAFDTVDGVDHQTLLSLLHDRSAVSDESLSWFHSYLTKRTQTFKLTTSSTQTSPLLLHSGVPQRSGLGPASFLTYNEGTADIFSAHSLFSERELTFTFAICCRPSVCRLPVCLSSVTPLHPTQPIVIFGNISTALGTLAIR